MTITEFLLARIAEDDADARTAIDDDPDWLHVGRGQIIQGDAPGFATTSGLTGLRRWNIGDHIARWDPARVLAECAAKRAIIDQAFVMAAQIDGEWGCCHSAKSIRADEPLPDYCYGPETAAQFLSPLAAVYADHPDYDTAWSV